MRLIRCLLHGFVDYSNFEKVYRELEVRTATYGPGIDQSQYAKSVSHIIKYSKHGEYQRKIIPKPTFDLRRNLRSFDSLYVYIQAMCIKTM